MEIAIIRCTIITCDDPATYTNVWQNDSEGEVSFVTSCDVHADALRRFDRGRRYDVSVYLPVWQPRDSTSDQRLAIELLVLELARWR
jgi:hypothetical protein